MDLLPELYHLIPHLKNPRLTFRLLLIEAEDYRLLNGWSQDKKKGSDRYERVPLSLLGDLAFVSPEDFSALLPATLPSPFTVKELSRATGLRGRDAYSAAHVLSALGLTRPADPVGRAMAFVIV